MSIRKIVFSVLILGILLGHICFANMASPFKMGTLSGTAMTSSDIDILKEKIYIQIHKENHTALYKIDYYIRCDSSGMQIPMLFYAVDFKDNFKVWVDNKEVKTVEVPDSSKSFYHTPLEKFQALQFRDDGKNDSVEHTEEQWVKDLMKKVNFDDLKYFETNLSKGDHQIHVEYTGAAMTNRSGWVKEYTFNYSLYPAKFWRSFNSLEIAIKILNGDIDLKTNLGHPMAGAFDSIAIWKFDKLPADEIELSYKPQINFLAKALMNVNPFGLTILFFISMTVVHYKLINKHRINNPDKKYSWVKIVGIIVVPLLTLIWFIWSFELIDTVIGKEASRYHGYTFMAILFYPVLLFFYWYILRLVTSFLFAKRLITNVYNELNKLNK